MEQHIDVRVIGVNTNDALLQSETRSGPCFMKQPSPTEPFAGQKRHYLLFAHLDSPYCAVD
jgi:hypothetical protein